MLIISYKSVYYLLEQYYQRRSLNQVVFGDDVGQNVFEASKVFAMTLEDYDFMDVMVTKRDELDKKYAIFVNGHDHDDLPIILERDKDLSLIDLAILSKKCLLIKPEYFLQIVESQSESKGLDATSCKNSFQQVKQFIDGLSNKEKPETEK